MSTAPDPWPLGFVFGDGSVLTGINRGAGLFTLTAKNGTTRVLTRRQIVDTVPGATGTQYHVDAAGNVRTTPGVRR